jgi:hypothetical protein
MFCSIYKWYISRSLDSGKSLPTLVSRHIRRCASCRQFAQFSESLENRLVKEVPGFLDGYDESLNGKILSTLARQPEPKRATKRRPALIPVLAAASAVLVISIAIVWLSLPSSGRITPLNQLAQLRISKASFENALVKIDSPYEEELTELKQTLKSTADFLLSRVDIKIGEREEKSPRVPHT